MTNPKEYNMIDECWAADAEQVNIPRTQGERMCRREECATAAGLGYKPVVSLIQSKRILKRT